MHYGWPFTLKVKTADDNGTMFAGEVEELTVRVIDTTTGSLYNTYPSFQSDPNSISDTDAYLQYWLWEVWQEYEEDAPEPLPEPNPFINKPASPK